MSLEASSGVAASNIINLRVANRNSIIGVGLLSLPTSTYTYIIWSYFITCIIIELTRLFYANLKFRRNVNTPLSLPLKGAWVVFKKLILIFPCRLSFPANVWKFRIFLWTPCTDLEIKLKKKKFQVCARGKSG